MSSFFFLFIHSSRVLYNAASQPPPPEVTSSTGTTPEQNPYIFRINEIRDTVTKGERVPFLAYRLRKCFTRSTYCQWHCGMAVVLAILLGLLFHDLPITRAGIEKRENLFRIIVRDHSLLYLLVCHLYVRRSFLKYVQYDRFQCFCS